jgi:hypothetical protein
MYFGQRESIVGIFILGVQILYFFKLKHVDLITERAVISNSFYPTSWHAQY